MASKEVTQLVRKLRKQGFEVELTGRGHYRVRRGRSLVCTLPSTPSSYRGLKNTIAQLKRAGYRP